MDAITQAIIEHTKEAINQVVETVLVNHKQQRYYNKKEIKKFLHIGDETLEDLFVSGLKQVKVGRSYLIDINDVYELFEQMKK